MVSRVTVAICTYNRAEMLLEAIQSVLSQTFRDMKIIVLDNCSTDHTEEVVGSFDDPRLSYIRYETHVGMFANWNRALDICDTEYINIFHDDDIMLPWMIETEMQVMDKHRHIGMIGSSVDYWAPGVLPARAAQPPITIYRQFEFTQKICKRGLAPLISPSVMLRMDRMRKTGLRWDENGGPAADMYSWIEMDISKEFGDICTINEPLVQYRKHMSSGTALSVANAQCDKTFDDILHLIVRSDVPCDLKKLQWYIHIFSIQREYLRVRPALADIDTHVRHLRSAYGWKVGDSALRVANTTSLLDAHIRRVASGEASLKGFFAEVLRLQRLGVKLSYARIAKWMYKYVLRKK